MGYSRARELGFCEDECRKRWLPEPKRALESNRIPISSRSRWPIWPLPTTTRIGCFLCAQLLTGISTLSSDFHATLRRLKPDKRRLALEARPATELPYISPDVNRPRKLLYDTTVYIDILQGRFPQNAEFLLRVVDAWHSTVTEGELAVACGLLNPAYPNTKAIREQIASAIDRRPVHRILVPDRETWTIAGVLSGMLARLQGYSKQDSRRVLNDALLFSTARKHGCTVLTRNVRDFDFLQQLEPSGHVLFYRV